jgi:hypothetical protein
VASRTIELVGLGGSIKCVFGATDAPSASDDETRGFSVGSMWKAVGGALYVCDDPSEGAAAWRTGAPDDPSPSDFGTLILDFDPANAVLDSGYVASMGAGLGSYAFVAANAAPARPTLNATDADFNGMPSVEFGEAGPLITDGAVTPAHNVFTQVVVCRLGAETNGRVIMESSPDANSNPLSFAMLHDGLNMRTNKSGASGNTCQRNRDIADYEVTIHYGMTVDFAEAGSAGITHYQDGVLEATSEGFDNGATAGGPAGAYVGNFGARNSGAGQWFVGGRIARGLWYVGEVDHAGLYEYLAGIYGA